MADANEKRDWRIYADFAMVLIQEARKLYAKESFGVNLRQTAYALDATTIDLCLSVFPWAKFRSVEALWAGEPKKNYSSRSPAPASLQFSSYHHKFPSKPPNHPTASPPKNAVVVVSAEAFPAAATAPAAVPAATPHSGAAPFRRYNGG